MKVAMPNWWIDKELKAFIKSEAEKLGMTMTGYLRHLVMKDKKRAEREERRKPVGK